MKKLKKRTIKAIENLGWRIKEQAEYYELENWSPAGENLVETISKGEDLERQFYELWDNFDEEEHIEMWVEARHSVSGVPSIKRLCIDAEEISEMFYSLWQTVAEQQGA